MRVPGQDEADFWSATGALAPTWAEAKTRHGNALLALNQLAEGTASWASASSLQSNERLPRLVDSQLNDWWSSRPSDHGAPEDFYPQLYNHSVRLLHEGNLDAHLDVLRKGIEMQEAFAHTHGLYRLGVCFLREWTYAIGHMALLDVYVKMELLGLRRPLRPIIVDPKPANPHYLQYWRKYLPSIITDKKGVELVTPLAERLEEHLHLVTYADMRREYHATVMSDVESLWRKEKKPPLLQLSSHDHERGWEVLKRLGVPSDAWFVGLHVRSTANFNNRNSSIESYRLAIESIAARGGWVIRMGDKSMPKMPVLPNTIDYVHTEFHSDWMDVFLWGRCRFFIGTNSGPLLVPPTFGIPSICMNTAPIMASGPLANTDNIAIYKLYWSTAEKRHLTLPEIYKLSLGMSETVDALDRLGIEMLDNSPEEINEAVLEMLDRVEGKLKYTADDNELQRQFKAYRLSCKTRLAEVHGRVGKNFLERYRHLL